MQDAPDISHLATSVGGVLSGMFVRDVIAWARGAKKDQAEISGLVGDALNKQIAAMTTQTTLLIQGYERRVEDLMSEVHKLREEVVSLRQALDVRGHGCSSRTTCKDYSPFDA